MSRRDPVRNIANRRAIWGEPARRDLAPMLALLNAGRAVDSTRAPDGRWIHLAADRKNAANAETGERA